MKNKKGIVNCNHFPIFTWIISIIIIVVIIVFSLFQSYIKPLQSQLSECQDDLPTLTGRVHENLSLWRLTYKCEVLSDDFGDNLFFVTENKYYELDFEDEEFFDATLKRFEKRGLENCKVLNIGERRHENRRFT